MKHIACAVAFAAASLLGNALAASTYTVSPYTAPALPANDWQVSLTAAPTTGPGGASTWAIQASNAVTGQSSTVTYVSGSSLDTAVINRRGDVLLLQGDYPHTINLYSGGQLLRNLGTTRSGATLDDEGSVRTELFYPYPAGGPFSWVGYQGGLYANGQWHYVGGHQDPGSSAVNDINSAGWVAGMIKQESTSGDGSEAAIASPTNVATRLPGVAGYGVGGFQASALSINDSNVVVGWQANFGANTGKKSVFNAPIYETGDPFAFIWDSANGSRDLNSLIDPSSSLFGKVHLSYGDDIDNLGNIIARGFLLEQPGTLLTFKISAVPEAQTWAMIGLGLVGIAAVTRRRRTSLITAALAYALAA